MGIPAAMPDRRMEADAANHADMAKAAARSEPVDEKRSRPVGTGESAFQDRDLEGQIAPSSFGLFRTTTASSMADPSLFSTDMVAFGGSLAKLSLPSSHCLMKSR